MAETKKKSATKVGLKGKADTGAATQVRRTRARGASAVVDRPPTMLAPKGVLLTKFSVVSLSENESVPTTHGAAFRPIHESFSVRIDASEFKGRVPARGMVIYEVELSLGAVVDTVGGVIEFAILVDDNHHMSAALSTPVPNQPTSFCNRWVLPPTPPPTRGYVRIVPYWKSSKGVDGAAYLDLKSGLTRFKQAASFKVSVLA